MFGMIQWYDSGKVQLDYLSILIYKYSKVIEIWTRLDMSLRMIGLHHLRKYRMRLSEIAGMMIHRIGWSYQHRFLGIQDM